MIRGLSAPSSPFDAAERSSLRRALQGMPLLRECALGSENAVRVTVPDGSWFLVWRVGLSWIVRAPNGTLSVTDEPWEAVR